MLQTEENPIAARLSEILAELKRGRKLKNDLQLALDAGYKSASAITEMKKGRMEVSDKLLDMLQNNYSVNPDYILLGEQPKYQNGSEPDSFLVGRQRQKLESEPYMVPLVSVPAQAGYIKSYDQVDFINKLERYPIVPGVDHRGAEWRYFTVDGESMEDEIRGGDVILASRIHVDDWQDIKNYHTHVIITDTNIWIKDVFKESEDEWILLSQNRAYKPFKVKLADINELWVMRRHIRNRVPKKERYNIEEIKKNL